VSISQPMRAKIAMMVVSMLVSLLLWIQVQSQTTPPPTPEVFNVPLEVRNLDDTRFSVTFKPPSVPFRAIGTPEQLRQIDLAKLSAYVELDDAEAGIQNYEVRLEAPTEYRAQFTPLQRLIRLEIERVVRKEMPITIEAIGLLMAPGLVFTGAQAEPEVVVLVGPESQIDQVTKVRALLDLTKVQPRTAYPVNVEPLREGNRPLGLVRAEPNVVLVRPALTPAPQEQPVLIVPRFTGGVDFGFRVSGVEVLPTQVFVSGTSEALATMKTLETRPIDLNGLRATRMFTPGLDLPPGIRLSRTEQVRVRVVVEADPTAQTQPPGDPDGQ
jgi:YbbR domain-containing protein